MSKLTAEQRRIFKAKIINTHAVVQKDGVCVLCGKKNLSEKDANDYCENPLKLTLTQAVNLYKTRAN